MTRKKSVKRQKQGGRLKPQLRKTKWERERERYEKFAKEVDRRVKTDGLNHRELFDYRSQVIDGREFECIGWSMLHLSKKDAEREARNVKGYVAVVLPEGSSMWRVWTSVEPVANMPKKPSEQDVAHLRSRFETFMRKEVMADINKYQDDPKYKAKTLEDVGVNRFDTTWGDRSGLYAGGSLRGKVDYTHPILLVHMDTPEYLEYQISHKANGDKYGIFIEPYSSYLYMVTRSYD